MITDIQFLAIIENAVQHPLSYLFQIESECIGYGIPKEICDTFEKRRELFLWCLQKSLNTGILRLAKNRIFLGGTNTEQVQLFRERLPHDGEGFDNGIWFFYEECPGEAVWILDYELGDITKPIGNGKYYYWT